MSTSSRKGERKSEIWCLVINIMFILLQDLSVYSSEEKVMMAEVLRCDQLKERREKARNMVFSY